MPSGTSRVDLEPASPGDPTPFPRDRSRALADSAVSLAHVRAARARSVAGVHISPTTLAWLALVRDQPPLVVLTERGCQGLF